MPKAVNKVIYVSQTLIDLTDATASSSDILLGQTAYGSTGAKLTGALDLETLLFDVSKIQDRIDIPGCEYASAEISQGRLYGVQDRIGYPGVYPASGRETNTLIANFQDHLGYPDIYYAEYPEEEE